MKVLTSALVLVALLGAESQAIKIRSQAGFTDDLVKELAADMAKDAEEDVPEEPKKPAPAQAMAQKQAAPAAANATQKAEKKAAPANNTAPAQKKPAAPAKAVAKKEVKTEEEEIPMDPSAIKAYSSVIADAAEDSEPSVPVVYTEQHIEEEQPHHEAIGLDPMGSMIQNEITSIKKASIKAAAEKED